MKKIIWICLIPLLFFYCKPTKEIERYMKDGVEVVVNHLEPYQIKGEPTTLHLEEEFTIDTEKDYIAERGLAGIDDFDVDSEGNIFCLYHRGKENCIYKFDKNGSFVNAFGRSGQGPGELLGASMSINSRNEIIIQNVFQSKLIILSSDGNLIHEIPRPGNLPARKQMENENYFTYMVEIIQTGIGQAVWSILSPEFEKIKDIEKQGIQEGAIHKFYYEVHVSYATEKNIYIGKKSQPYEVWVYNAEGDLKRIIKKDYRPIKVSDEYKKKIKEKEEMEKEGRRPPPGRFYVPEYWPAIYELFADEAGWLFVMTYEISSNPREFVYDIFNPDGLFIGKMSLDNYDREYDPFPAKARNNLIYCIREKESGYTELVVYKMNWE